MAGAKLTATDNVSILANSKTYAAAKTQPPVSTALAVATGLYARAEGRDVTSAKTTGGFIEANTIHIESKGDARLVSTSVAATSASLVNGTVANMEAFLGTASKKQTVGASVGGSSERDATTLMGHNGVTILAENTGKAETRMESVTGVSGLKVDKTTVMTNGNLYTYANVGKGSAVRTTQERAQVDITAKDNFTAKEKASSDTVFAIATKANPDAKNNLEQTVAIDIAGTVESAGELHVQTDSDATLHARTYADEDSLFTKDNLLSQNTLVRSVQINLKDGATLISRTGDVNVLAYSGRKDDIQAHTLVGTKALANLSDGDAKNDITNHTNLNMERGATIHSLFGKTTLQSAGGSKNVIAQAKTAAGGFHGALTFRATSDYQGESLVNIGKQGRNDGDAVLRAQNAEILAGNHSLSLVGNADVLVGGGSSESKARVNITLEQDVKVNLGKAKLYLFDMLRLAADPNPTQNDQVISADARSRAKVIAGYADAHIYEKGARHWGIEMAGDTSVFAKNVTLESKELGSNRITLMASADVQGIGPGETKKIYESTESQRIGLNDANFYLGEGANDAVVDVRENGTVHFAGILGNVQQSDEAIRISNLRANNDIGTLTIKTLDSLPLLNRTLRLNSESAKLTGTLNLYGASGSPVLTIENHSERQLILDRLDMKFRADGATPRIVFNGVANDKNSVLIDNRKVKLATEEHSESVNSALDILTYTDADVLLDGIVSNERGRVNIAWLNGRSGSLYGTPQQMWGVDGSVLNVATIFAHQLQISGANQIGSENNPLKAFLATLDSANPFVSIAAKGDAWLDLALANITMTENAATHQFADMVSGKLDIDDITAGGSLNLTLSQPVQLAYESIAAISPAIPGTVLYDIDTEKLANGDATLTGDALSYYLLEEGTGSYTLPNGVRFIVVDGKVQRIVLPAGDVFETNDYTYENGTIDLHKEGISLSDLGVLTVRENISEDGEAMPYALDVTQGSIEWQKRREVYISALNHLGDGVYEHVEGEQPAEVTQAATEWQNGPELEGYTFYYVGDMDDSFYAFKVEQDENGEPQSVEGMYEYSMNDRLDANETIALTPNTPNQSHYTAAALEGGNGQYHISYAVNENGVTISVEKSTLLGTNGEALGSGTVNNAGPVDICITDESGENSCWIHFNLVIGEGLDNNKTYTITEPHYHVAEMQRKVEPTQLRFQQSASASDEVYAYSLGNDTGKYAIIQDTFTCNVTDQDGQERTVDIDYAEVNSNGELVSGTVLLDAGMSIRLKETNGAYRISDTLSIGNTATGRIQYRSTADEVSTMFEYDISDGYIDYREWNSEETDGEGETLTSGRVSFADALTATISKDNSVQYETIGSELRRVLITGSNQYAYYYGDTLCTVDGVGTGTETVKAGEQTVLEITKDNEGKIFYTFYEGGAPAYSVGSDGLFESYGELTESKAALWTQTEGVIHSLGTITAGQDATLNILGGDSSVYDNNGSADNIVAERLHLRSDENKGSFGTREDTIEWRLGSDTDDDLGGKLFMHGLGNDSAESLRMRVILGLQSGESFRKDTPFSIDGGMLDLFGDGAVQMNELNVRSGMAIIGGLALDVAEVAIEALTLANGTAADITARSVEAIGGTANIAALTVEDAATLTLNADSVTGVAWEASGTTNITAGNAIALGTLAVLAGGHSTLTAQQDVGIAAGVTLAGTAESRASLAVESKQGSFGTVMLQAENAELTVTAKHDVTADDLELTNSTARLTAQTGSYAGEDITANGGTLTLEAGGSASIAGTLDASEHAAVTITANGDISNINAPEGETALVKVCNSSLLLNAGGDVSLSNLMAEGDAASGERSNIVAIGARGLSLAALQSGLSDVTLRTTDAGAALRFDNIEAEGTNLRILSAGDVLSLHTVDPEDGESKLQNRIRFADDLQGDYEGNGDISLTLSAAGDIGQADNWLQVDVPEAITVKVETVKNLYLDGSRTHDSDEAFFHVAVDALSADHLADWLLTYGAAAFGQSEENIWSCITALSEQELRSYVLDMVKGEAGEISDDSIAGVFGNAFAQALYAAQTNSESSLFGMQLTAANVLTDAIFGDTLHETMPDLTQTQLAALHEVYQLVDRKIVYRNLLENGKITYVQDALGNAVENGTLADLVNYVLNAEANREYRAELTEALKNAAIAADTNEDNTPKANKLTLAIGQVLDKGEMYLLNKDGIALTVDSTMTTTDGLALAKGDVTLGSITSERGEVSIENMGGAILGAALAEQSEESKAAHVNATAITLKALDSVGSAQQAIVVE